MKSNCGRDFLIPHSEWVPECCIQGEEVKTLKSPTVEKAFQAILKDFKPKHRIALVSLCTSTRPYSRSPKWKEFVKRFGDRADMIICSNGGIIPMQYETCYPYLTYDAHGSKTWDKLYIQVTYRRLMQFFTKFDYDLIVFNFRPKMRNRVSAMAFMRDYTGNARCVILPTPQAYDMAKATGFPKGKMFPDLDPHVLAELEKAISSGGSDVV